MDRPWISENEAERLRLKTLVAALSNDEMARSIGQGWTVGVGLAHLAFYDRLTLGKFEEWERTGLVKMLPVGSYDQGINDGMLPWWRNIAPAQVRHEVVAAAQAADNEAKDLPDTLVEAIFAVRPRTLFRATHRREHLDEIEELLER